MKKYLFCIFVFVFVCCFNIAQCMDSVQIKDCIEKEVEFFPLSDLRLLESDGLFSHAMRMNEKWLLSLEPDRLLSRYRTNAGLKPKGKEYGGWESTGVSGHSLGHYLSACSRMYAATGNIEFKNRVDYIVEELFLCQTKRGTGYVGAIPSEDKIWDEVAAGNIRSEGFDLNGGWVPWYTLHKLWAGLIDSYRYADCCQALSVVVGLSDWAVEKFKNLTEEQFQTMLMCEFGGMNEAFSEVYAITGNKKYLSMAKKFYHKNIMDPLAIGKDELAGKHSNTQIPKVIGVARMYELTGDLKNKNIAEFFWNRMVRHHSYLNGGNSNYEHLAEPDSLNAQLSAYTSETCNTYNMLKLTKHLFTWDANAFYIDYYERALYNHILASQNPETGMVCYYVPLETATKKEYSTPFDSFWCCVGSGMENHTKYAECVFSRHISNDGLMVNLYIPTELNWKEKNMKIRLETTFPMSSEMTIRFEGNAQSFPLYIRCPEWAKDGVEVTFNDKSYKIEALPGSYFVLNEIWSDSAVLKLNFPMSLYTESMPDNANKLGIFYGPLLLGVPLGCEKIEVYDYPNFISDKKCSIIGRINKTDEPLKFSAHTANGKKVTLIPFYEIYNQMHAVYFDVFTEDGWKVQKEKYYEIIQNRKNLELRTVDHLRIGEMQPERDHNLQSEASNVGVVNGCHYRDAYNGWFSFDVCVDSSSDLQMLCSYWGADKNNRNFDIYIDNVLFTTVKLEGSHGSKTFDVVYDIPQKYVKGKKKVNIKFQSHKNNFAGGLFDFRIIRKSTM